MKATHPLAALALLALASCAERSYYMGELAPLPGIGVAGAFCGTFGDDFLVAGGANFPSGRPWDGAKKVYDKRVRALHYRTKGKDWRTLETALPRPAAYGVSMSGIPGDGVFCIGGTDGVRCHASSYALRIVEGRLSVDAYEDLPEARAFACGARIGSRCYVFGGQATPASTTASKALFSIDLADSKPAWKREAELPGAGRILASAGVRDGQLFIVGGCSLSAAPDGSAQREYLQDAWCFDGSAWRRIADLPAARAGAPSPMLQAHGQLLYMGGDPGTLGGVARKDRHPGFATEMWGLAADAMSWIPWPALPKYRGPSPTQHPELGQMPPVTAPTAIVGKFGVIASGEIRPGVRCKRISIFVPGDEDDSRAILVLALILGLAIVPTILLVAYAFRLHARKQRAATPEEGLAS